MTDNCLLSLSEIHQASLELLVRICNLCNTIGVRYYLAYGTLLGAVRHKGFIPWDDDIDLWMLRDDYNRLFNYIDGHQEELYPLNYCSREHTKSYLYGINRITDLRYKYVEDGTNIDPDYGIFIDIYPLDYIGNSEKTFLKEYQRINRINILYSIYNQSIQYEGRIIRWAIKRIIKFFLKIRFGSLSSIKSWAKLETELIVKKYNQTNSSLIGVIVWWTSNKQAFPKDLFNTTSSLLFEGHSFYVPYDYDYILKKIYGDYMQLPPVETRHPYHGYKIYKRNLD